MRKEIFLIPLCLLMVFSLFVSGCNCSSDKDTSEDNEVLLSPNDDFSTGVLNSARWTQTSQNDFAIKTIDVYDVDSGSAKDYRLRLRANTLQTSDETIKYLGIRSKVKIDFSDGKTFSFKLDWNEQDNGSSLTAGVYLCPMSTDTNPMDEDDWISFRYIGVSSSENASFEITQNDSGALQTLYEENQTTGREIGNQQLEITIDDNNLTVVENDEELFTTDEFTAGFTRAYLYLQMSSHHNYNTREVYFDNIVVQDAA